MKGKVALVTGSTSGIGLGIAERLAQSGCNIVLNGIGESKAIEATRERLVKAYNVKVEFDGADLTSPPECARIVATAAEKMGRLDILVNNAGIQHVAAVEAFPLVEWQKVMGLNLTAPFCLIQSALPVMRQQKWGRIINIASVHGMVASKGKAAYVAAKHGLLGLTKVVALETTESGVTCNAVCPGWVLTPLVQHQIEQRSLASGKTFEEEKLALLLEKQPSGEFAKPEHIGGLVVFLCSEDAAQIRGAALTVDGGWTIQ